MPPGSFSKERLSRRLWLQPWSKTSPWCCRTNTCRRSISTRDGKGCYFTVFSSLLCDRRAAAVGLGDTILLVLFAHFMSDRVWRKGHVTPLGVGARA